MAFSHVYNFLNKKITDLFSTTSFVEASAAACYKNNAYKTGIYDQYPFVVTPSMIKGCTNIVDTPAYPTMFPYNLESYKVLGVVEIDQESTGGTIYIGTIETSGFAYIQGPGKITGSTQFYDTDLEYSISCAFANGASLRDNNTGISVPVEILNISLDYYSPYAADLYLVYDSLTAEAGGVYGYVSFEIEVFIIPGSKPTFTIY